MNPTKSELRCDHSAELRVEMVDERPIIRGYAIYYNSLSRDLGGFQEIIRPGALRSALSKSDLDVRALINHDPNLVLGRSKAGTLRMQDGERGLYIEIDPNMNVSYVRDLIENMKDGNISGMSFRFYMFDDFSKGQTWTKTPEGHIQREITEFGAIDDVSIVTYPAYDDASAAVRSLEAFQKTLLPQECSTDRSRLELRLRLAKAELTLHSKGY
jgi:HK97 family phage prohead protease